jgi:hypothetical protein
MPALATAEGNRLLDASFGTAAYVAPSLTGGGGTSGMRLALSTTVGTVSTAGSEVVGGSYARQAFTMAAAASLSNSNVAAINFTGMPAVGSPGVQGVEVYDNGTTPRREWFGALTTPRITAAGDTLAFAIGALVASFT